MKFHVGAIPFTLHVSDRAIYDAESCELEGCAVESRRWIVISKIVEPNRRLEVALHEYIHCWEFFVPPARTEEERAQFFAFASEQFYRDLDAQGGAAALEHLPHSRLPDIGAPKSNRPKLAANHPTEPLDFAECGCCQTRIMCGSITTSDPITKTLSGQTWVERWFQCECGIVQHWYEHATPDGQPSGVYVSSPRPRMLAGPEASQFLASWRQLRAV